MSKNTTFITGSSNNSGIFSNGTEIYTGMSGYSGSQYNRIVIFGDYIISAYRDASNQYVTTTQKKDINTGAFNVVPNIVTWSNISGFGTPGRSLGVSSDKTKLYTVEVTGISGGTWVTELKEYDLNLNLVQTYTSSATIPGFMHTKESIPFFVQGNKLVVCAEFSTSTIGTFHWTEWTISGTSLISPTVTNLALSTTSDEFYAHNDGINIYIQTGASLNPNYISKYTYSSTVFTPVGTAFVDTSIYKHNFPNISYMYQGFNVVSPTIIGIYSSANMVGNSGNNQIYKCQYLEYTF